MGRNYTPAPDEAVPILAVRNLSVGVGKRKLLAVNDISFDVYPGQIVGLVGESGCGKSLTCLSVMGLLTGEISIVSGSVVFDGQELTTLGEAEMNRLRGDDMSMIFQEPMSSLDPLMRIGQQITEPLRLHGQSGKKENRETAISLMEAVGLKDPESLLDAFPYQLSGGMRQRVMIATAIACTPKIMIADEATTALDVTIQAQILKLLDQINRDMGVSILFVSHDLSVIHEICDRVVVMYAGRIVEEGSIEDVFRAPFHEYTKGLIGSVPSRERKGMRLANIPGRVPALGEAGEGCPFAPRCPKAFGKCSTFPGRTALDEDHFVYCALCEGEGSKEGGKRDA